MKEGDFKLTPNFSFFELCATNNLKYKDINLAEGKKQLGRLYQLAGFAERIREIVGKPLIINSGYRCVPLNNAIGGSLTSQHCLCEAIDIRVSGKRASDLFQIIVSSDLKYDQLILEKVGSTEWVHVSIGSKKEKLKYQNGKYTRL